MVTFRPGATLMRPRIPRVERDAKRGHYVLPPSELLSDRRIWRLRRKDNNPGSGAMTKGDFGQTLNRPEAV